MTTSDWTKNLTDHPIFHGVLIEPVHGRQQCITLKDTDIILAVGKELRIASLAVSEGPKSYKVCACFRKPKYSVLTVYAAATYP